MQTKIKKTWFVLGNFPLISTAEISAVLSLKKQEIKFQIPLLITERTAGPEMIKQLGGTIKIGQELAENLNELELMNKIIEELKAKTGKIHFGLSAYGGIELAEIKNLAKKIKKNMTEDKRSVRFVFKNQPTLSSVTVEKNNLIKKGAEFLIFKNNNKFSLAQTLSVQPFEELGQRDYGRPGRDSQSGMLPPKLAMMMINLVGAGKKQTILDPFCGSGTILNEAVLLGYKKIIGSDLSEKAIDDAEKNLEWLKKNQGEKTKFEVNLFPSDVTELDKKIPPDSTDAIVTEPYLGKPLKGNESKQFLEKQAQELKQFYLKAFDKFKKILKPEGKIVLVIPCFRFKNEWVKIDFQKEIEELGFKTEPLLETGDKKYFSLLYWRPGQHLGREIWRFGK